MVVHLLRKIMTVLALGVGLTVVVGVPAALQSDSAAEARIFQTPYTQP
ncbi:hypothetical protein [Saccharothrix hoggarensis]|uniref:Uncharacterized protein n=1 Tax=Saccharothrix hoggarensis TaxID=913853 RepID=A0ABW3QS53_9PSEU